MVHLGGIGGHEFSVGRFADRGSPFTESKLTALGLSQTALLYTCVHEFENANSWKKHKKKSAPPKTHHESHSSPATTSNSRRHARKHVTPVSPYYPASIDSGFVEIGIVQLSQSVKTTNVTHTLTDTETN